MSIEPKLDFEATASGNGRLEIAAKLGGKVILIDVLNPTSKRSRSSFIKSLIEKAPALTERRAEIDELLMNMANTKVDHNSDNSGSDELDISRIVRPEQFFTSEVCGLSMPTVVNETGNLRARWNHYLRWSDGKRECRSLARYLDLPDNSQLWMHPVPGDPSVTNSPAWSGDSRQAWLQGACACMPADLFAKLCELFAFFLDFPENVGPGTTATLALWTMLTYTYQAWDAIPYLHVCGPLSSGKSTVFEILSSVVYRPLNTSNITGPALFRTLHDQGGTVLYDEAERLRQSTPDQQELLSMLLAGYKRGGQATRLDKVGDGFQTVRYDVFGPKALACIAGLPPNLASRCIPINMFRADPDSPKPRRRVNDSAKKWQHIRDDLHIIALEYGSTWLDLAREADICPHELHGRSFELWQPILALASWVESSGSQRLLQLVRDHALAVTKAATFELTPEADELLLQILTGFIRDEATPTSSEILEEAQARDYSTFKSWGPRGISNRLRHYGLQTRSRRGRREFRDVTLKILQRIQRNYGIDLGLDSEQEITVAEPLVS